MEKQAKEDDESELARQAAELAEIARQEAELKAPQADDDEDADDAVNAEEPENTEQFDVECDPVVEEPISPEAEDVPALSTGEQAVLEDDDEYEEDEE